jgi:hypothetical protein
MAVRAVNCLAQTAKGDTPFLSKLPHEWPEGRVDDETRSRHDLAPEARLVLRS